MPRSILDEAHIHPAIRETIAHFPVYRTYVHPETEMLIVVEPEPAPPEPSPDAPAEPVSEPPPPAEAPAAEPAGA